MDKKNGNLSKFVGLTFTFCNVTNELVLQRLKKKYLPFIGKSYLLVVQNNVWGKGTYLYTLRIYHKKNVFYLLKIKNTLILKCNNVIIKFKSTNLRHILFCLNRADIFARCGRKGT